VWVFFADIVSAAVARSVGTALIHEAIVLCGSMDLRSYDRLFPNQDVLRLRLSRGSVVANERADRAVLVLRLTVMGTHSIHCDGEYAWGHRAALAPSWPVSWPRYWPRFP
jgi:hypothetical protein